MRLRDVAGRLYVEDRNAEACEYPRQRATLTLPVLAGEPLAHSPVLDLPVPMTPTDWDRMLDLLAVMKPALLGARPDTRTFGR